MLQNKYILLVFRLIVGGVFIWAGVSKIVDPLSFAQDVRSYQLVGQTLSFLTALFLPWVELIAGVWLIAGIYPRASAMLISCLLAFFIILVAITIARGLNVECGCFGTFSRRADIWLIVEDSIWLILSLILLFSPGNDFGLLKKQSNNP
ncbi:MAG: DoxX family membrane protein [Acidobacteriota bacterium]|nr:DoxX family membrane protein [Acidobacteriota bacterium]